MARVRPHYALGSPFNPYRLHPILHIVRPHNGTDIVPTDQAHPSIYAVAPGTVISAGDCGSCGFGNLVVIDVGGGIVMKYAHLNDVSPGLRPGQKVKAGTALGHMGTTGLSTGTHLHFEIWSNGTAVDPITVLKQKGAQPMNGTMKAALSGAVLALAIYAGVQVAADDGSGLDEVAPPVGGVTSVAPASTPDTEETLPPEDAGGDDDLGDALEGGVAETALAEAKDRAMLFAAAWSTHPDGWVEDVQPIVTGDVARQLSTIDPRNIPDVGKPVSVYALDDPDAMSVPVAVKFDSGFELAVVLVQDAGTGNGCLVSTFEPYEAADGG